MCPKAMQMLNRLTFRRLAVTGSVGGPIILPDLSRAYMFWVMQGNTFCSVYRGAALTTPETLPYLTLLTTGASPTRIFLREYLGPTVNSPMCCNDPGSTGTVFVYFYEYSAEDMATIYDLQR